MSDIPRLLLVGVGRSGSRFLRAAQLLEDHGEVTISGVCDVDRARLARITRHRTFSDLSEAIAVARPTAAVVAVNDMAHFDILMDLLEARVPPRVIACEKPLTSTLEELRKVEEAALRRSVSLMTNYLERFSPVVAKYLQWEIAAGAAPFKAEFFWGKNRVGDRRPNLGVFTEISHPLDLLHLIIAKDADHDIRDLRCLSGRSDYLGEDFLTEYMMIDGTLGDCAIMGHCSFGWARRDRRVHIYSRDQAGDLFAAELEFDRPVWDSDHLMVARHCGEGRWEPILTERVHNSDYPSEEFQIAKLTRFLRSSLGVPGLAGPGIDLMPNLARSAWVQRALAALTRSALEDTEGPRVGYGISRQLVSLVHADEEP